MGKRDPNLALVLEASTISIDAMARGVVFQIAFHCPTPKSLELMKGLEANEKIKGLVLRQKIDGVIADEPSPLDYEFMAFFPDVLQRRTTFYLFLKNITNLNNAEDEKTN